MTRIALAALLATGLAAGAAQAQAPSSGGGNIVGGGLGATITGGGDNMSIQYSQPGAGGGGAGLGQAGRLARFGSNQGDGAQVEYLMSSPAGAGREAWMTGGGEDAQVVYARPR
ncbi:hypothetical protein [Siccirubricoccus sp. G192]|uniref:hypothetical protein n=1 Tax=Siccirubricoccus sp. G192 TaxID=2849651 RepID=UPI001C2C6A9F|nr:hypothetical protein [Siccirubricoccus sp. G192]MBV1796457.1 hypothetical protein [Siccirubricoccus sp. G192]